MNISSILVNAGPQHVSTVEAGLAALAGVEVHAVSPEGRMIVTIESDGDRETTQTYEAIQQLPGVLSLAMVYHHFEPDPEKES
ncbi:MAG: chaperone NapD [Polyangiaceae bacterium]